MNHEEFDGPGASDLASLEADAVWMTMVPGSVTAFRLEAGGGVVTSSLLNDGEALYLASVCAADIAPAAVDNQVNVEDLLVLLGSWGVCIDCPADVDGDDIVNVTDLLALLEAWGPCP